MSEDKNIDLVRQFFKVQSLLNKLHFQSYKGEGFSRGVHRGQGMVLSILKNHLAITQKELVRLLDMRPQSLGELLSKLESQGFIKRSPSEKDRRVMVVTLTEKGLEEISKNEEVNDPTNKIFDILSEDERNELSTILNKITNELENNIDEKYESDSLESRHIGHPGREDMMEHFMSHFKEFRNKTKE